MAKDKKFRHKTARPSLAASLEAVRQGRVLESVPREAEQPKTDEIVVNAPSTTQVSGEAAFVKSEVKRIALIMGVLIALLVGLTIIETRTGFLTESAKKLLAQ